MKVSWRLASMRPGLFVLTAALYTLYSCIPLVTGELMRQVLGAISSDAPAQIGVWSLLALLLVTKVGHNITLLAWNVCTWCWFFILFALLRSNLFRGLLLSKGGPAGEADEGGGPALSSGQIVNRLRDDVEMFADVINEWYRLTGQGLFAIAAVVVMVGIDPVITALTALPIAGVVVVVHLLNSKIARYYAAHRDQIEQVNAFLADLFASVTVVKLSDAVSSVTQRFDELGEVRRRVALKEQVVNRGLDSLSASIQHLTIGLVLLLAAGAMRDGDFTVGDFALFIYYLEWTMEFPRRIGRLLAKQRISRVAGYRLSALMRTESMEPFMDRHRIYLRGSLPSVTHPVREERDHLKELTAVGLCYQFPETGRGIDGIDLRIERGQLTVITGRVASGKTTLLRVLLGLIDASRGEVRWNGQLIERLEDFMVPPRCAYCPQVPRLFSETLRDNILMGRQMDASELEAILNRAVLERDVVALEHGLDTVIGPRGVKLSGGQVQRTAAARMMACDPELLVVDDLSSALDVETEQLLWARLGEYRRAHQVTCLAVSHRAAALRQADQIVVLKNGSVADRGRLDELLERSEEMRRIWRGEE